MRDDARGLDEHDVGLAPPDVVAAVIPVVVVDDGQDRGQGGAQRLHANLEGEAFGLPRVEHDVLPAHAVGLAVVHGARRCALRYELDLGGEIVEDGPDHSAVELAGHRDGIGVHIPFLHCPCRARGLGHVHAPGRRRGLPVDVRDPVAAHEVPVANGLNVNRDLVGLGPLRRVQDGQLVVRVGPLRLQGEGKRARRVGVCAPAHQVQGDVHRARELLGDEHHGRYDAGRAVDLVGRRGKVHELGVVTDDARGGHVGAAAAGLVADKGIAQQLHARCQVGWHLGVDGQDDRLARGDVERLAPPGILPRQVGPVGVGRAQKLPVRAEVHVGAGDGIAGQADVLHLHGVGQGCRRGNRFGRDQLDLQRPRVHVQAQAAGVVADEDVLEAVAIDVILHHALVVTAIRVGAGRAQVGAVQPSPGKAEVAAEVAPSDGVVADIRDGVLRVDPVEQDGPVRDLPCGQHDLGVQVEAAVDVLHDRDVAEGDVTPAHHYEIGLAVPDHVLEPDLVRRHAEGVVDRRAAAVVLREAVCVVAHPLASQNDGRLARSVACGVAFGGRVPPGVLSGFVDKGGSRDAVCGELDLIAPVVLPVLDVEHVAVYPVGCRDGRGPGAEVQVDLGEIAVAVVEEHGEVAAVGADMALPGPGRVVHVRDREVLAAVAVVVADVHVPAVPAVDSGREHVS